MRAPPDGRRLNEAGTLRTLLLLAVLGLSALSTEMLLYSRNTLHQHPHWVVGKTLATSGIMGWVETMKTRNLLAGNRLNLNCWHGYQEILWDQPLQLGRLTCQVRIADGARLHLQVERTALGGQGFHLSRHPDFRSQVYQFEGSGKYRKREPLELSLSERWYRLELSREPNCWRLRIDGKEVACSLAPPGEAGLLGFRGNFEPAQVDDVRIEDIDGRLICQENFRNDDGFLKVWFVLLVLLALPTSLILRRSRRAQKRCLLSLLSCTFLVFGVWQTDLHYWSHRYPYYGLIPGGWGMSESSVETARAWLARRIRWLDRGHPKRKESQRVWAFLKHDLPEEDNDLLSVITPEGVSNRIRDDEPACKALRQRIQPGDQVVILLGTSQAWGAGANHQRDRIQWQLHHALGGERFWLVNGSRSGSRSGELLARYENHLVTLYPDLLVICLSANDSEAEDFRDNLEAFIRLNQERGISTLLVKEPLAPDSAYNDGGHRVLDALVGERDVPFFDLHQAMGEHLDEGILYWDFVHLTSFGQHLIGQLIAQEIRDQDLLRFKPDSTKGGARGSLSGD